MKKGEAARAAILEAIKSKPSGSYAYITDRTGLSKTTISYHMEVLARRGRVARGTCGCCGSRRIFILDEFPDWFNEAVRRTEEEGKRVGPRYPALGEK